MKSLRIIVVLCIVGLVVIGSAAALGLAGGDSASCGKGEVRQARVVQHRDNLTVINPPPNSEVIASGPNGTYRVKSSAHGAKLKGKGKLTVECK